MSFIVRILLTTAVSVQCRKGMARIKYVINERRLAYEGAVKLFAEQKAAETRVARRQRRMQKTEERKKTLELQAKARFVSDTAQQVAESLLHSGREPSTL
jgi:large subunit ribosomal protein L47